MGQSYQPIHTQKQQSFVQSNIMGKRGSVIRSSYLPSFQIATQIPKHLSTLSQRTAFWHMMQRIN